MLKGAQILKILCIPEDFFFQHIFLFGKRDL